MESGSTTPTQPWSDPSTLPGEQTYVRVTEDGDLVGGGHPSTPVLAELFALMAVTRGVDEEAINLQRQGQLGVYASSRGQEAVQVGTALALRRESDWLFPSYRELGSAIAWGVDPRHILHMWRGTWFSDYDFRELRYGLQTIPVATQLLHATGFAMGMRLDGADGAVLTFVGDGSTSEGDFHEALNFAATWQVPCVFIIQNNGYAISVPTERQTAAKRLSFRGVGYGIPAITVDGNDAVACFEVAEAALLRAREGQGPSLIEAVTYRMEAHTTSDDAGRYRDPDEVRAWARRDPIDRLRKLLAQQGWWSEDMECAVEDRIREGRSALRAAIYDAPHGDPMELFEHVYSDSRGFFPGQRELLRSELESGSAFDST
jgi:2-oxoisovalerate dehydrogenase E1 component alpha subunit